MANSLDMKVMAEGIETAEQMNKLINLECDYGQGFFFNTPIDRDVACELINEQSSRRTGLEREEVVTNRSYPAPAVPMCA